MTARHEFPHMPGQGSGCRRSTSVLLSALLIIAALAVAAGATLAVRLAVVSVERSPYPYGTPATTRIVPPAHVLALLRAR